MTTRKCPDCGGLKIVADKVKLPGGITYHCNSVSNCPTCKGTGKVEKETDKKGKEREIMFRITQKKGFHVTFENGYCVSVQFGPGDYCDNYNGEIGTDEEACGKKGSTTAECAIIDSSGEIVCNKRLGLEHAVSNRSKPKDILRFLIWAEKQQIDKER